jgi:hypothetical protein
MVVKSERIAALALTVVVMGTISPVWGQASKPAPTAKPALTPAELMLLNGFYRAYSLEDGEVLKHFAPPFHPGRIVYYHQTQPPALIRSETEEPDSFVFHWHETRLDCVSGAVFGVGGLSNLIPILVDFDRHEIEGDEELLNVPVRGDWILRTSASDEQILAGMERILRDKLQIPVKTSVKELERKVLVAKGDFRFTPIGESKQIQVYGQTLVKKGGGGGSGDLSEFLRSVGGFIGRRVVSDVRHLPEDRLRWHYNVRFPQSKFREEDRNVEKVLRHVTEQTGLKFSPGVRPVRVLLVERAP